LPRRRHECHRAFRQHKRAERSDDEQLATVTVADPTPQRRADRGDRRRRTERQTAPHRNLADIGDTQLADVERQEGHHHRKAGEAHEAGRSGDEDVPPRL
jgi:hypothetical protein